MLAPASKAVATPITIGIAEKTGGIAPLTVSIVVLTGAWGLCAGRSSAVGPTSGALIGLNGLFTALLIPRLLVLSGLGGRMIAR